MKKMRYLQVAVLLAGLAGGCRTADSRPEAEAMKISAIGTVELDEAVKQGRLMGNKILKALQNNDFQSVATLPVGDGKQQFTQERFDKLFSKLQATGGIAGFEYLGQLNMNPYRRLFWKISFKGTEKAPAAAQHDMLFEMVAAKLNGEFRAVGFGFRN